MNKIRRLIVEVILALFGFAVISLFSAVPSVSRAEPVGKLPTDSALIAPTAPKRPMPEPVRLLGIAFTGAATIFRRKAA
jgi:hypothetical protein